MAQYWYEAMPSRRASAEVSSFAKMSTDSLGASGRMDAARRAIEIARIWGDLTGRLADIGEDAKSSKFALRGSRRKIATDVYRALRDSGRVMRAATSAAASQTRRGTSCREG